MPKSHGGLPHERRDGETGCLLQIEDHNANVTEYTRSGLDGFTLIRSFVLCVSNYGQVYKLE
jgi:hypothetical protein